jgi:hypothetical protein
MRSKGEYLGSVEAPDRERAEAVAVKQFELDEDQRRSSTAGYDRPAFRLSLSWL